MNISCAICSDLFIPAAEVYTTQCGHMFHFPCLVNWIERSKTCPQCRCKSTENTIYRVYFNLANTDGIIDDVGTLNNKLENVQFQLTLKEKDIKTYKEKYKKCHHQTIGLREEISELENKIKAHESAIYALKDQLSYFKSKAKENDRLSEEVAKLRTNLKDLEHVQVAINGTREQVNEMLRNENNIESLALLAATLKKSLLDVERKKRDMEYGLKRAQNDSNKYRREVNTLECQNNELRKEIQVLKENSKEEKQYLKNKIIELNKKLCTGNSDVVSTSLNRIIAESPVNFNKKRRQPVLVEGDEASSPSVAESVQKIIDSDSPYLPVKSSNIPIDILTSKSKLTASKRGFSIFKSAPKTLENAMLAKPSSGVVYNGLGGSSKEDIFPSPKPRVAQMVLKRNKSSSSLPSSKFRKLAPNATRTKVTDFFSETDS